MIEPYIYDSFRELPETIKKSGIPLNRAMLVGDSNTLPLYGLTVSGLLGSVFREVHSYAFPAGEEYKNLGSVEKLLSVLMEYRYDRSGVIFALGGGVTGDMAGFAAAVYLRGIRVVQLPTTLLAQVDSSIGGKTGVDFKGYKNMVGAFHLPVFVYTNPSVLKTLDENQFSAGMGEVIKSALIADGELFEWLKKNRDSVTGRDEHDLLYMIRKTARIKTEIVKRDPKDTGERALLNLGHTIGHAIEKYRNFTMLHGHCVGAGLMAAARISANRGLLTDGEEADIRETLRSYDVPVCVPGLDAEEILRISKSDKKMDAGQIRFILPDGIGHAVIADDVTDAELNEGIRSISV